MNFRDALVTALSRDSRYSIQAYAFVFEALEYAKTKKKSARIRERQRSSRARRSPLSHHVTGQELCHGVRELALRQYGLMALTVLGTWGIRSTSDLGEIVYNLISTGDLEKTQADSRSDFDNVFDFVTALRTDFVFEFDEVA